MRTTSARRTYGREELLRLRNQQDSISRKTRRTLWYYKLLRSPSNFSFINPCKPHTDEPPSAIPVLITSRKDPFFLPSNRSSNSKKSCNLVKVRFVSEPRKPKSSFSSPSILYFNARSLKNKIDELSSRCLLHNPDVVAITETWLDPDIPDSFVHISGYNLVRCDRDANGGGVAFYIRSSIAFDIVPLVLPSHSKTNILACRLTSLSVFIFCVYHPYWGSSKEHQFVLDFLQDVFDSPLCSAYSKHQFILCGDVNGIFPHLSPFLACNNLCQLINFNTRGSNTLDVFACSYAHFYLQPSKLSPLGKSDHSGFFVSPSVGSQSKANNRSHKVHVRDFNDKCQALFLSLLSQVNWDTVLSNSSLNDSILNFTSFLSGLIAHCFPSRVVRMRNDDKPWMTPDLKLLFNKVDRAYFKNYPLYLILRDKFRRKSLAAKAAFSNKLFSTAVNSKQTWRAIKKLGNINKDKPIISDDLADNLSIKFSQFFNNINVGSQSDIFNSNQNSPSTSSLPSFSELDVFLQLKKVRASTRGILSGRILRLFAHELALPLCIIYNKCISENSFPDSWKLADVVPIPKGKSDFRPISMLPPISKVFEKLFIRHILVPSLNVPLNPFQFGFTPTGCGGCSNAVTYIRLSTLQHIARTTGYTRMLTLDFSKAFDRAVHSTILSSLKNNFNLDNRILRIIHSFLSNRWQRVLASSGYCSSWIKVTSGVPQGSVLGPLLFALMIDSFPSLNSNSKMLAYADDIVLLHHVDANHPDTLQSESDLVLRWASDLSLSFNLDKCNSITFSRSNFHPSSISLNGSVIPEVPNLKFLGVTLQSDMKWNIQLSSSLSRASRNMYIVKSLWLHNSPPAIIWQAYLSFVFGSFNFCWPALCDLPYASFNKLLTLEKTASKWSCRSFSSTSLSSRLDCICIKLVNNITKSFHFHPLAEFFTQRNPSTHLRRVRRLRPLLLSKKAFFNKSFVKFSSHS